MDEMMRIDMTGGAGVDSQANRSRLEYDSHRSAEAVGDGQAPSGTGTPSDNSPTDVGESAQPIDIKVIPQTTDHSMQGMQHTMTPGGNENLSSPVGIDNGASAKP